MKKLLIILLIILLCVLGYVTIIKGYHIGSLDILSIARIDESSKEVDKKLDELNNLVGSQYQRYRDEQTQSSKTLLTEKKKYLDIAELSTDTELEQANKRDNYNLEFLYTQVGTHAKAKGANLNLSIQTSSTGTPNAYDLSFNCSGQYIAIMDFIYGIENDSSLGFVIENFKLLPGKDTQILQATFLVKDIGINIDRTQINTPTSTPAPQTNTQTNTTTNTSTSDATNTTDTGNEANTQ